VATTTKVILVLLLGLMVVLTSCQIRGGDNPDDKYFTGTDGVRMEFVDSGSPPLRMYYYPQDTNDFSVNVKVHNRGASFSRGGIYLSGYDPGMIHVAGVNIPHQQPWQECVFDLVNLGHWSNLQFYFDCLNTEGEYGDANNWHFRIDDLAEALGPLVGDDFAEALSDFNFGIGEDGGALFVDVGWDDINLEYMNLGVGLMVAISQLNFARFNGKEYFLYGDNYYFPGGEEDFITFQGQITDWPANLEHTTQPFLVTNCYAYSTYAAPDVCIDPRPFSETRKVCQSGRVFSKGTQGAPVAITRVDAEPTPKQVFFTIHVKNMGRGDVIDPGYLERCSPYFPGDLESNQMNIVYLGDIRIGNDRLVCIPRDYIRLDERTKTGQITCVYDIEYATASSAYKTPLIIELWYGYSETILRNMYIKRVG